MTRHDFNTLMAALDSPLIVVTTADERERAGCLVEFHVQSSIEPQRYCVWLSKANYTYRVALHSSHLVIHFLTADDLPLAELFGTRTGDTVDKFAGLDVDSGPGGAPVLRQCQHWVAVRRVALLDEGGDHVCLTTEPVAAESAGSFRPLRVSQASHLRAGHGPGERPEPPTERAAPA
jgi:flavin reductase (DIM6/NTAB) family NADH-FMN oxidoreductase RutF